MGYYIKVPTRKGKAKWLIDNHSAYQLQKPFFAEDPLVTVVVVDNGPFEAAGILYDEQEFQRAYSGTQNRETIWLTITKEKAVELCPEVNEVFKPKG